MGMCGQCRVLAGEVSSPGESELDLFSRVELARADRLACCSIVAGDARIYIPKESLLIGQRLQVEGDSAALQVDPVVQA